MKKEFYLGIVIIIMLALGIVGYGAWLNYSDENQIARRMDNRALQVTGAKAMVRELHPTLELPAVRFTSDTMTDAVARIDGRILQWYVGKNKTVKRGEPILSLANDQLPLKIQQAGSAVSRAEALLAQAYSAYQRQGRLLAKQATSQEKYEAAEAQYLAAREAVQEAQAQREQYLVQEGWLTVTSPVDGEVILVYQHEGAFVQAGTPVALVGNFDWLTFSLNLADSDTRHLVVGENSTLNFPDRWTIGKAYDTEYAAGNQGWNQKVQATLKEIVPPLDEPADVRRVVWTVDNRTRLLEPMTYTEVTMQTGRAYRCLTVPLAAMIDNSNSKVYVVDGEGIIHLRDVVTGTDDNEQIEILRGLEPGEVVVVESFEGLTDGTKVEVTLEGDEGR